MPHTLYSDVEDSHRQPVQLYPSGGKYPMGKVIQFERWYIVSCVLCSQTKTGDIYNMPAYITFPTCTKQKAIIMCMQKWHI